MGTGLMPGVFGQTGVEHMRKYGTTQEQFAKIAVKNHKHSVHNPYAQYQVEVSLEDVMNARMIAWPNTLYMCCPTGDGAAAAVLVSEAFARRHNLNDTVRIRAQAMTTDRPSTFETRDMMRVVGFDLSKSAAEKVITDCP